MASNDEEINVRISSDITDLKKGLSEAKSQLGSMNKNAQAELSEMAHVVGEHSKSSHLALKGLQLGMHELGAEFGITGRLGRVFGHEMGSMFMSMGSGALVVGTLSLALMAAEKVYEHFATSAEKAAEETKSHAEEYVKAANALYGTVIKTYEVEEAEKQLNKTKIDIYGKDATKDIENQGKEIGELKEKLEGHVGVLERLRIGSKIWLEQQKAVFKGGNEASIDKAAEKVVEDEQEKNLNRLKILRDEQAKNKATAGAIGKAQELVEAEINEKYKERFKLVESGHKKYEAQKGYNDYAIKYAETKEKIDNKEAERLEALKEHFNGFAIEYFNATRHLSEIGETMWSSFSQSATNAIKSVITGTQNMRDAMRSMLNSMLGAFIDFYAKIAFNAMHAALVDQLIAKADAQGKIQAAAATGGANAAASTAAIPGIGPAMALPAGEAMYGEIVSMFSPLASAAGGYDIPSGINPVTQLHQQEMVLPASLADKVRTMTDSPGMNVTINALDAKSVKRLFMDHGETIAASLQRAYRTA